MIKKQCEPWGENWTVDFPHKNMTPKGHNLVFQIPKKVKNLPKMVKNLSVINNLCT